MKRWLTALASMVAMIGTLSACDWQDEQDYLDHKVIWNQFDSDEEALAFGHQACDAIGDDDAEFAFAAEHMNQKWQPYADEQVELAFKYLCPEHEGEMIYRYNHRFLDATGRVKGDLGRHHLWDRHEGWYPYGDEQVDKENRVLIQPYLHNSETQWVAEHPTMPDYPRGADVERLIDHGPLVGAKRILDVRILNPDDRSTPVTRHGHYFLPDLFDHFDMYGDTVPSRPYMQATFKLVRTIPAAGEPVDLFTGITLVGRWEFTPRDDDGDGVPNSAEQPSDSGNSYSYSSGGDDDFNVPGWLCPTRFC